MWGIYMFKMFCFAWIRSRVFCPLAGLLLFANQQEREHRANISIRWDVNSCDNDNSELSREKRKGRHSIENALDVRQTVTLHNEAACCTRPHATCWGPHLSIGDEQVEPGLQVSMVTRMQQSWTNWFPVSWLVQMVRSVGDGSDLVQVQARKEGVGCSSAVALGWTSAPPLLPLRSPPRCCLAPTTMTALLVRLGCCSSHKSQLKLWLYDSSPEFFKK